VDISRFSDEIPALEVRNLRKRFGRQVALDGVHFELQQGERLGLLGPNGAGKTTLVRCLARRIRADEGEIQILGAPLAPGGTLSVLGVVPQELAIYEDLTAKQNLNFFGKIHGMSGRRLRERVHWALDWTGLSDRSGQLVRYFSGGMKRRINLACGVMHAPKILLLDEPTVGVDPQSRERIYTMIDSLSAEGCSVLLTTHHMEEAEGQCERLVIMDRGQIVADGKIDVLTDQAVGSSRYVRLRIHMQSGCIPGDLLSSLERWEMEMISESDREKIATMRMHEVAKNLPNLLEEIHRSGVLVTDVEVQSPSLHDVFLELTGAQLRDV